MIVHKMGWGGNFKLRKERGAMAGDFSFFGQLRHDRAEPLKGVSTTPQSSQR